MARKACLVLLAVLMILIPAVSTRAGAEEASPANVSPPASEPEDNGAGYLPYSEPSPFGTGGMLGSITRTIFSLVIVLGLLYVALWGLKKISANSPVTASGGSIRIVGRVYLNPKSVIHFVRLVDELLVIGTSSGNIALLSTVKDAAQIEQIESALKGSHPMASGKLFSRFFQKSLLGFQQQTQKDDPAFDDRLRALDDQIGRLKGLSRKRRSSEE
ncbi:MAG: hypothetical protein C4520_20645 [Candidatus Abyssobacteria bacterium SURF_5]|uniref:Flagellar protein n=1 Tax=Abyssobacteria bacterium (strain SURF_5) TaxID=2093360 RepID=A0A3A4MY55_ABYX5|nr:MAG: hypothetical protein C4520_20645 [Candidatus Abyssubacteria bacterium SURF_5]